MFSIHYNEQTKAMNVEHVYFKQYAMQRTVLPPLLYCLYHTRRYDMMRHRVGLNLGERWN